MLPLSLDERGMVRASVKEETDGSLFIYQISTT